MNIFKGARRNNPLIDNGALLILRPFERRAMHRIRAMDMSPALLGIWASRTLCAKEHMRQMTANCERDG